MRKDFTTNQRFAGGIFRGLAAASLACSLALLGCTTDHMPGAGRPDLMGPGVGPTSPTETPGSEFGTPVPMASSYTRAAVMESIEPRPVNTDALAIAAADQAFRGRTLGFAPSQFGPTSATTTTGATVAGADIATGQFINPSMFANPAATLNSSISSSGPFVNSTLGPTGGPAGVGIAPVGTGGLVSGTTSTGSVATSGAITTSTTGSTLSGQTSAVVVTPNGVTTMTTLPSTIATPTNTAFPLTVGQFAAGPGVQKVVVPSTTNPGTVVITNLPNGSLTPTVSSGALLTPTQAANPAIVITNGTGSTSTVTTTPSTSAIRTGSVTGPLVMQRGANGTITISNITASPATGFQILSPATAKK